MFFDQYNAVLNKLCEKHGLKHGFVVFAEGQLSKHYIYKDVGVKTYLCGLIKKPQRHFVAEIVVEPNVQVNRNMGYLSFGELSIELIDDAYQVQVQEIAEQIRTAPNPTVFQGTEQLNIIQVI